MLPCWHVPAWSINLPIGWAWCGGLLFIIIYFWVSFALPTSKTLEKIPHNDVLGQIHPLIGTFTQMNLVFNSKWWQQVFQNEFQPFRSQMNFSTGRTIDLNLTIYVKGSPPPPFFWTTFVNEPCFSPIEPFLGEDESPRATKPSELDWIWLAHILGFSSTSNSRLDLYYETASCETEYKLIKREGIKLL